MILFANGDSHTYGEGVEENKPTFPTIVSEHFNMRVLNRATPGGSNDCILRTSTRESFNHNFFILIGWTSWEREEWLYNNYYYQVNGTGHKTLPKELQTKYKEWVSNNSYRNMVIKSQQWHDKIWNYHLALEAKGIKHLFFNAFTPFMEIDTPEELLPINKYDWKNSFITPYTETYYDYLLDKGYEPNEHYHFKSDGHNCWAEYLIKHIEEYDIIYSR